VILTIDIGTSNFKCALWSLDGKRLFFTTEKLISNINNNKHEANPKHWILAFESCCKRIENISLVNIIVICGNGPSLVPVLKDKENIENARLWLDKRAEEQQKEVSEIMGGYVDAKFFLPKILHIKNNENELFNNTQYFLGCPEYLAYKLTGQAKTVFPSEGFDRWFWNDNVLEKLEMDKSKFPPFIMPGDLFGEIMPQEAEYYGFKKNIPVISGGPDFYSAILGSGVVKPSQALDRTGSSEGINLCTKDKVIAGKLMSYGHPVKPYWNLSGIINKCGIEIEENYRKLGISGFNEFILLANENEYANSIMESICYEIKDLINIMEEAGENVKELRVTGGLAGFDKLNQLKANITGKEVLVGVYKEAELLGCAIIGSRFLGEIKSYEEASFEFVKIEKVFEPNLKK